MEPENEHLSLELLEWIARSVGGRVVQVRRQARWRPNYFVDVDAPGLETIVLKSARAPRHVIERSALLSTFNSHREAVMLELLQDQDVKVPPCPTSPRPARARPSTPRRRCRARFKIRWAWHRISRREEQKWSTRLR